MQPRSVSVPTGDRSRACIVAAKWSVACSTTIIPAGTGLVSGATFGRIAGRNAAARTHEQVVDTSSATRSVQPNPVHQPPAKKIVFAARGDHEAEETTWVP